MERPKWLEAKSLCKTLCRDKTPQLERMLFTIVKHGTFQEWQTCARNTTGTLHRRTLYLALQNNLSCILPRRGLPDFRPNVSYGYNIVKPLGKSHARGWWSYKWRAILWHDFCIPILQSTPLPWLSLEVEPLWSSSYAGTRASMVYNKETYNRNHFCNLRTSTWLTTRPSR